MSNRIYGRFRFAWDIIYLEDGDMAVGRQVTVTCPDLEPGRRLAEFELRYTQCCGLDELSNFWFENFETRAIDDEFIQALMMFLASMTNGAVFMVFRKNMWRESNVWEYQHIKRALRRWGCTFSKNYVNRNTDNILSVCTFLPDRARGDV